MARVRGADSCRTADAKKNLLPSAGNSKAGPLTGGGFAVTIAVAGQYETDPPPRRGLTRFYFHSARQARGSTAGSFVILAPVGAPFSLWQLPGYHRTGWLNPERVIRAALYTANMCACNDYHQPKQHS